MDLESKKCGDKLFNALIKDANENSDGNHRRYLMVILTLALGLFLYLLYLCIHCFCGGKKKKKYDEFGENISDTSSVSSSDEDEHKYVPLTK